MLTSPPGSSRIPALSASLPPCPEERNRAASRCRWRWPAPGTRWHRRDQGSRPPGSTPRPTTGGQCGEGARRCSVDGGVPCVICRNVRGEEIDRKAIHRQELAVFLKLRDAERHGFLRGGPLGPHKWRSRLQARGSWRGPPVMKEGNPRAGGRCCAGDDPEHDLPDVPAAFHPRMGRPPRPPAQRSGP